ncbi:unnamed protein product [Larinioides sclopetarius]|uniref:Uncharacterized protein n=1 Tax=Larinioides sclopetarius TaxID=280406 RepID=A0AAV1YT79_9ARAC
MSAFFPSESRASRAVQDGGRTQSGQKRENTICAKLNAALLTFRTFHCLERKRSILKELVINIDKIRKTLKESGPPHSTPGLNKELPDCPVALLTFCRILERREVRMYPLKGVGAQRRAIKSHIMQPGAIGGSAPREEYGSKTVATWGHSTCVTVIARAPPTPS